MRTFTFSSLLSLYRFRCACVIWFAFALLCATHTHNVNLHCGAKLFKSNKTKREEKKRKNNTKNWLSSFWRKTSPQTKSNAMQNIQALRELKITTHQHCHQKIYFINAQVSVCLFVRPSARRVCTSITH